MQIINQIWEILDRLQSIAKGKREELVDDYKYNFNALVESIINLGRIVDGETPYGRPIQWGITSGNCIPINNNMDLPCKQVGRMWLTLVFH